MKILIVDDDDNKVKRLVEYIRMLDDTIELEIAKSYKSGKKKALASEFDLMLLDMSMPTFDKTAQEKGGRWRKFGGRDLLSDIKRRGKTIKTVVVTQFDIFGDVGDLLTLEQLTEQLRNSFPGLFYGSIYYNAAESRWRDNIGTLINDHRN
jgi:CheY-like chemotaxis protein